MAQVTTAGRNQNRLHNPCLGGVLRVGRNQKRSHYLCRLGVPRAGRSKRLHEKANIPPAFSEALKRGGIKKAFNPHHCLTMLFQHERSGATPPMRECADHSSTTIGMHTLHSAARVPYDGREKTSGRTSLLVHDNKSLYPWQGPEDIGRYLWHMPGIQQPWISANMPGICHGYLPIGW